MKSPLVITIVFLFFNVVLAQEPTAPEAPITSPTPPKPVSGTTSNLDFMERSSAILSKIRDNDRQIDPFGFPMDPTDAVDTLAMSKEFEELDETPMLNASAFKTAIQNLPISGIYPSRQTIVIGARSFSRGEQFGMKLEELTIRLRVEGIKGSLIYFRDMDTQEVASVDFNPRPAEFEPITRGSKPSLGEGITPMDSLFIVN